MDDKQHSLFSFLILIWILVFCPQAHAIKSLNQINFTLDQIREKIIVIKKKENIEEAQKLRILYAYYETEDNLEEIESFENQIESVKAQQKSLPDEINQLKQRITKQAQKKKNQKQENFSNYRNDELEQRLFIEKSNLTELNADISYLDVQIAEQIHRPQQIREQIAELKKFRDDTYKEQLTLSKQISNKHEINARQMQFDSRLYNVYKQLSLLDLEDSVHPVKREAQKLELQWLKTQVEHKARLIKQIDDVLTNSRQKEIDKVHEELKLILKHTENKHQTIYRQQNSTLTA